MVPIAGKKRKITVEVSKEILRRAQQATGAGITETVRLALELLISNRACDNLLQFQGKVRFSRSLSELKHDR